VKIIERVGVKIKPIRLNPPLHCSIELAQFSHNFSDFKFYLKEIGTKLNFHMVNRHINRQQ